MTIAWFWNCKKCEGIQEDERCKYEFCKSVYPKNKEQVDAFKKRIDEWSLDELKNMVDVNTIVGSPVTSPDGTIIIPISKVSFAFLSGGSEFGNKTGKKLATFNEAKAEQCCVDPFPFGGGSAAGVSLKPVSFLVVKDANVRLLNLEGQNNYDKILESIPDLFNFVKELINKDEEEENETENKASKKKRRRDKKIHDKTIHDEKFSSVETDTN